MHGAGRSRCEPAAFRRLPWSRWRWRERSWTRTRKPRSRPSKTSWPPKRRRSIEIPDLRAADRPRVVPPDREPPEPVEHGGGEAAARKRVQRARLACLAHTALNHRTIVGRQNLRRRPQDVQRQVAVAIQKANRERAQDLASRLV